MSWLLALFDTLIATLGDIFPIVAILFGFQLLILRRPLTNAPRVLFGFLFVLLGLTLFLVGLERALFPIGRLMAEQLTAPDFLRNAGPLQDIPLAWADYYWVLIFAFTIGFATTLAEPSLIAVALKANQVSGGRSMRPHYALQSRWALQLESRWAYSALSPDCRSSGLSLPLMWLWCSRLGGHHA
ncbi:Protein of unknown function [Nitrosomonas halophila]|uniref:DUF1538 domain-containing protein n=1 Tax=Nitrosomonas halophila TaxID=44576 RepID=A0A1H3D6R9_9PROT|nr:Protein of unknown function [Nitrosomonas halophila]